MPLRRASIVVGIVVAAAAVVLALTLFHKGRAPGREAPDHQAAGRADSLGGMRNLTPEQRERLERIATLGYVAGTAPVPAETGVTRYVRGAAFEGYTLFTAGAGAEAFLIDMEGEVVHRWASPGAPTWVRVRCLSNGDLLVVTSKPFPAVSPCRMMKLDSRSRVLWRYGRPAHHDFDIGPDGTIYVLVRRALTLPELRDGEPTLDDAIAILDRNGNETGHVSIYESFRRSERYGTWLDEVEMREGPDMFHTNSIEIFERDGRLHALLSLRHVHALAIIDMVAREVVWVKQGPWRMQHEATFVEGGILFFDNVGLGDRSRVLEIDPETSEILWEYAEEGFYTKGRGAQQRLPNGNTLISESERGRIFEITRSGETVWEYINPRTAPRDDSTVLAILRAERLPADFPLDWARGEDAPD